MFLAADSPGAAVASQHTLCDKGVTWHLRRALWTFGQRSAEEGLNYGTEHRMKTCGREFMQSGD